MDHAGVLLAVYDMQANKRSRTGYTVHYVQSQKKPVVAIDRTISASVFPAQKNHRKIFYLF